MKNNTAHKLVDPYGETGSITFTSNGTTVEVSQNCHPDLPATVTTLSVHVARDAYRAAVAQGMVPAPSADGMPQTKAECDAQTARRSNRNRASKARWNRSEEIRSQNRIF